MRYFLLTYISILLSYTHLANSQTFMADIQFVEVHDSLLIHSLSTIIDIEENNKTLFAKDYGYFNVGLINDIRSSSTLPNSVDTIYTYDITMSFAHPNESQNGLMPFYPAYYGFVNNRLLAFNLPDESITYSAKSKLLYEHVIEKFLEPENSPSRKTLWQLDYHYTIDILQNRSTGKFEKPVIKKIYFKEH